MTPDLDGYLSELGISDGDDFEPSSEQGRPLIDSAKPSAPLLQAKEQPASKEVAQPAASSRSQVSSAAEQVPSAAESEELVRHFLQGIADRAFPGVQVRVRLVEDCLEAELLGEDTARMVGRGGATLHALETLAFSLLAKHGERRLKVRLDAGGYRGQQQQRLFALAARIAEGVVRRGEAHHLQPMNPAERRLMHMALQDHPQVYTESQGAGRERHLVVYPRSNSAGE